MIKHLPASASADEICAALGDDGCVVVDNVVRPEVMDEVARELRPFAENTPLGPDDFSGRRTRRTGGLIARSPKSRELVMHPVVLGATGKMLGHATSFQLHLTQIISIGPGEPAQTIHRDQWAFDFFPFPRGYEVQCNTIWAMTDFTAENGATRVIPGSNHFDDKLRFTEADTEPAEMSKGSVLFYTGSIYHGGGANRSKEIRTGINITYNVSWLRQEENQYLSVPLDDRPHSPRRPAAADGLSPRRLRARLCRRHPRSNRSGPSRPRAHRLPPRARDTEISEFLTTQPRASTEKSE